MSRRDGHQASVTMDKTSELFLTSTELSSVIKDHAPTAIKTGEIKNHFGRKVAIVSNVRKDCIFNANSLQDA